MSGYVDRLAERVVRQEGQMPSLLVPCYLQAVVIGIHFVINNFHRAETILGSNARPRLKRARQRYLVGRVTIAVVAVGMITGSGTGVRHRGIAVWQPTTDIGTCGVRGSPASSGTEHCSQAKIIDLVEIVVPVAQVVGFAADVSDFQLASPWQPLSEGEAVALGARFLVVPGIKDCDATGRG